MLIQHNRIDKTTTIGPEIEPLNAIICAVRPRSICISFSCTSNLILTTLGSPIAICVCSGKKGGATSS
ncbi:hypothetical protein BMETH_385_1 [methanotrophic bacterial endosymbiont of Bathymodiolus sp.]|nr:hypothetical protein BMETH_385_1 [methanotrophic bacterial endosymbiont of Bathymodiolus sp.]